MESDAGGIRQLLNERPRTALVVGGLLVIAALAVMFRSASGGGGAQAYFTADDGKTYFSDSASKIPPFMHHGHEASLAVVVSCDGGTTKRVGYLLRYTPEAKARNEAILKKNPNFRGPLSGEEVRRPGEAKWVRDFDKGAADAGTGRAANETARHADDVRNVKCPDGSSALVYPAE